MTTILSTFIQLIDSFYGLPIGTDVIVSVVEDWVEMYKVIRKMKVL